jgi:NAD dependent epimerase/dehydratase family enzyme
MPTPGFALRVALGKVASILTTGQRVAPRAAVERGFVFRYPTLPEALADLVRDDESEALVQPSGQA